MLDDRELLRSYAEDGSETAFAELVQRHIKFVYSAALRRVANDSQTAQDVTQTVFSALARKAPALSQHPLLSGWLYRSTRYAANDAMRTHRVRQRNEQEAATMKAALSEDGAAVNWDQVSPVIDPMLDKLDHSTRSAVLLRFFEGKSFAEVAAKLKITEDAARMKVNRALDRLRDALQQRGIVSYSTALAVALTDHAIAAPLPIELAPIVTRSALAGARMAGSGILPKPNLWNFMSTSKVTAGAVAAIAILALGTAIYEGIELRQAHSSLAASDKRQDDLRLRLKSQESRPRISADGIGHHMDGSVRFPAEENGRVTKALVDARYKHALELARQGDNEAALKEFLWCYDEGFPRVSAYRVARNRALLQAIARLGDQYPAALAALSERRDAAKKDLLASAFDFEAVADFVAINGALHADDSSLELYAQMALDDPRRSTMNHNMYNVFVSAQLYQEALQSLPYAKMSAAFDGLSHQREPSADTENRDEIIKDTHDYLVATTLTNIETLAGGGDLAHARQLADRLLQYDGSAQARERVQQHANRAGHPELLTTPPPI